MAPNRPRLLVPTLAAAVGTFLLGACDSSALARDGKKDEPIKVEVPSIARPAGETPDWWFVDGAAQAAARGAMSGRARNVILFVGDGMSLTTVAAARILEGQRKKASGEENLLSWEQFPATALSKTYNTDSQTPDSAGTMSAMATGVKTRAGVLSIGQQPRLGDCAGALKSPTLTLWELAAASGMASGVVTTTRMTHATPGATLSHSASRSWENDRDLPADMAKAGCEDIAKQMILSPYGQGPDVLMGGGRSNFMTQDQVDPEYPERKGHRQDGQDLIALWKMRHPDGSYVWNSEQLQAAPAKGPLLALFEADHMQFEHDRVNGVGNEPSLAEMTRAAITRLQNNKKGYVLLVEGGRIDHAHHTGNAFRALSETISLSDAVRAAAEMTSEEDTLILVTADHSHTLSFAGYPERGNPILGKVRGSSGEGDGAGKLALDSLGLPYTTLGYANGPGYPGASGSQAAGPKTYAHDNRTVQPATGRPDLNNVDTEHPNYLQEAGMPMIAESHGGDDVGIWARGPGSQAVRGTVEQNVIFHFMVQATPALREALCAKGGCESHGVPVKRPDPAAFRASQP